MRRPIRNLQQQLRGGTHARRHRERRPVVEALEERALLSAAPDFSAHGLEAARRARPKKPVPGYVQTNLVSNLSSENAQVVDPNLKNPWGMAFSSTTSLGPGSPFWTSDAGSGKATIYTVNPTTGVVSPLTPTSLVVTIPSGASPTGQVFNGTSDFVVTGPNGTTVSCAFIFDTLQGTIDGWNPRSTGGLHNAVLVHTEPGAQYTGLAEGSSNGSVFLYAANDGSSPGIDVYNSSFSKVTLAGTFVDPKLRKGFGKNFVPYNIEEIGGHLFVTYRGKNFKGGAVAEFNTDGTFVRQFSSNNPRGPLQAPWGVAIAPANFGKFSNDLLVGNFGNGRINALSLKNGKFRGTLAGTNKKPIVNSGLWTITFGNDGKAGSSSVLYFNAGINGQADGLFGALTPVTS